MSSTVTNYRPSNSSWPTSNTQRVSGLTDVVSFTNDMEYKLAYRGAFFYPFTFHMRLEYPPDRWTVEFARALVSFPEFDDRLIVYKTDGKKDINKGRTAEKLVEILGMSEPVALAATCAICCASRDLSRLLRHDVVREESDESVPVEKIAQNFFYGPVMAALAVKTSGTSRFKAYIRYKDEEKGTWVKQLGPTSRDARDIVELKLMATGGWSEKMKGNKRTSVDSTQSSNREPSGPISADNTAPRSRTIGSFLVPSTYTDPRLVSGRSRQTKPVYAKEYDPPDGEYLVHATDINSVVSIFKTGLVPGSIQHERTKHLQSLVPAQGTENGRTTVQFTAISNSKHEFLVRDKKDILLVFSGVAIATSYDCWEADDQPIISTPCQIRPDLIIAALTANHVLYEHESCPAFVVKNIAFWWSNYLKERDINLYDQGLATASQLKANRIFQPRKLVQASANACQRDDAKSKKPPSHLRGKQISEWKAQNDPDSLEAKLAPKGSASSTTTFTVPPPPPAIPPPNTKQPTPPPPPSPEDMEVDQEAKPASSAAVTAESGDDIPAEAEDQDSAEEADVAQRLAKHRSVNSGQEKVLCQDEKGETVSPQAKLQPLSLYPNYRMKKIRVKSLLRMIQQWIHPLRGPGREKETLRNQFRKNPHQRRTIVLSGSEDKIRSLLRERQRPILSVLKKTHPAHTVAMSQICIAENAGTPPAVTVGIPT